jgi:hypothetical protein
MQAICSIPRKLHSLYSQRLTKRRKLCSQAKNRSTFQRRQKRRKARPSCVGGFRRLLLCGAIKLMPYFRRSCWSKGSLSYAKSPSRFFGSLGAKLLSSAASTSWVSCGEALATCTATGTPFPSVTAMILVPLPRFVLPTAEPPFSPRRRWRRWLLRLNPTSPGALNPRPEPAKSLRTDHPFAISENAGDRFDRADNDRAGRATALPCARSTTPHSRQVGHRGADVPFHLGAVVRQRLTAKSPTDRRSGPFSRWRTNWLRATPLFAPYLS